ncbi:hypothetical protein Efla_007411 [Eimeria flavescens]
MPYSAANEAYCNYVNNPEASREAQPLAIPPAVLSILQDFLDIQKEPRALPPPRKHQHNIPLYPDAEPQLGVPIFCIKTDGELRLVVDHRGLNSETQPDKFPLPLIDVLIDTMSKSKVFSSLDLRNGFYQIRMVTETSSKLLSTVRGSPFPWYGLLLSFCPTFFNKCGPFAWPHQRWCRSAVANIKYRLANSPVLSIFDGFLPTRITSDASSFDIGALLEQQHPEGWHFTQFLSSTLSKSETNYPVIDKEWLAVIHAV